MSKDVGYGNCGQRKVTLQEATRVLVKALNTDEGYRYSWQANIAVMFQDEYSRQLEDLGSITKNDIHGISNEAAINFLNLLCRIK